jgi:arylsulfatase A-like enzyme
MKIYKDIRRSLICIACGLIFSPLIGLGQTAIFSSGNERKITKNNIAGFTIDKVTSANETNNKKQPNVILVMTDDQGYGDICANGSPYLKTPNLDQLYKESTRLTNFHSDPSCSPTRAALMTGQYSARSGVWHTTGGRYMLDQAKITMADVFKFNGYKTGIFGKWHLGENYPFRPEDRGFEESVVFVGAGVGSSSDYWGNDYFDDTYFHNGKPQKYKGYCDKVWFDEAISFIRKNRQQPFFCYLPTNIPHAPLRVDKKYSDPYRTAFAISDRLADYYGMIAEFDEELGRLLKEIRLLGLEENTILVFMSDNGPCPWFGGVKINNDGFLEEGYSAGMRGGKIWGYDNAHRVPCFIRWPGGGVKQGKDLNDLTAHFDLLPTFIDACGLKNPGPEKFDGVSLLPILTTEKVKGPDRTIIVQNQRVDFPVKYKEYQVLTDRWRLVNFYKKELEDMEQFNKGKTETQAPLLFMKEDQYELYDILADPGQKNNLAGQFPEIVKELNHNYEDWWDSVSKNFDQYNNIIIGAAKANPTLLDGQSAHEKGNLRVWAIEVETDGKYKIGIARWPKEANKRISENRIGKTAFTFSKASVQVGNVWNEMQVNDANKVATFYVDLKAGKTCLQAFFSTATEKQKLNAEYVYVERMGAADTKKLKTYHAASPDELLKK